MNYYPFHVGDYSAHTKHLTLMGDLAYRRLLDLYYLSERPLPLDPAECARRIGMRDYINDVAEVLSDFFLKSEEGWTNKRADAEIEVYRAKADRARSANSKRWEGKRDEKSLKSDLKSDADRVPTNNQEPITKNQSNTETPAAPVPRKRGVERPSDVSEATWDGFIAIRKAKKSPLSVAALDGIRREASKASLSLEDALSECCARGWQGFKAEWVAASRVNGHALKPPTAAELRVYEHSPSIAAPHVKAWFAQHQQREVIDVTALESH